MKPYSLDLRQKIVESYKNQEGSIRHLAKRFKVSPDCVRRLVKLKFKELPKRSLRSELKSSIYLPIPLILIPLNIFGLSLSHIYASLEARTREVLHDAVRDGLQLITLNDVRNWFAHCCYCT